MNTKINGFFLGQIELKIMFEVLFRIVFGKAIFYEFVSTMIGSRPKNNVNQTQMCKL